MVIVYRVVITTNQSFRSRQKVGPQARAPESELRHSQGMADKFPTRDKAQWYRLVFRQLGRTSKQNIACSFFVGIPSQVVQMTA